MKPATLSRTFLQTVVPPHSSSSHVAPSTPNSYQQRSPTSILQQHSNHASSMHAQPVNYGPAPPVHVNYEQHSHPTSPKSPASPTSYPYQQCWTKPEQLLSVSDPKSSQGGSSNAGTQAVMCYKCGICKGPYFPDRLAYNVHMSENHFPVLKL